MFLRKTGFKTKHRQRNIPVDFISSSEFMIFPKTGYKTKPRRRYKFPEKLFMRMGLCFWERKRFLKLNIADEIIPLWNLYLRLSLCFLRKTALKLNIASPKE